MEVCALAAMRDDVILASAPVSAALSVPAPLFTGIHALQSCSITHEHQVSVISSYKQEHYCICNPFYHGNT